MGKPTSYETGRLGEDLAERYLTQRGYKILQRNAKILRIEIDIIAEKDGIVIFAEVKTRSNLDYGSGVEMVDRRKQIRIIKAASIYMNQTVQQIRFDVVSIELDSKIRQAIYIQHILNAFSV